MTAGGLTLPGAVGGGDGEVIGLEVFQPVDDGGGLVRMLFLYGGHVILGPVEDLIARDVGQLAPAQGDLFAARLCLQSAGLDHAVGGDRDLGDDVLKELDALHGSKLAANGLGDGDGDLLHRHPLAQGDGDDLSAVRSLADGVDVFRRGVVKGMLGGAPLVVLYQDDAGEDLAAGAVGGGEAHLGGVHRLL